MHQASYRVRWHHWWKHQQHQEQQHSKHQTRSNLLGRYARTALFASYDRRRQYSSQGVAAPVSPMTLATTFADKMLSIASQTSGDEAWVLARHAEHYETVRPLLNKVLCVPASSAPVERVFSYGGIIARPHRAKLSDEMLSAVVYLKCNAHINWTGVTKMCDKLMKRQMCVSQPTT